MDDGKVLRRLFVPTETDYREAVREIILGLQKRTVPQRHTQKYIAQRLGVSEWTVRNAQEMHNSLSGWVVWRIQFEFGADAIAPIMALGGVSVSPDASADTILVARIRSLVGEPEDAGERRGG